MTFTGNRNFARTDKSCSMRLQYYEKVTGPKKLCHTKIELFRLTKYGLIYQIYQQGCMTEVPLAKEEDSQTNQAACKTVLAADSRTDPTVCRTALEIHFRTGQDTPDMLVIARRQKLCEN